MASGSLFEAFVTLSVKGGSQVKAELASVESQGERTGSKLKGLSSALTGAGKTMTAFATGPIVAAGVGVAKLAGDSEAATVRMKNNFGTQFGEMTQFLKTFQKEAPASMTELKTAAAGTQGALTTLGVKTGDANKMTKEALDVANNLAVTMNIPLKDAMAAVQSGYSGNTDALRNMNYNLNQSVIDTEAQRLGLVKSGESADGAARAQAVHSLVLKQSSGIMNAASKQSNTFNFQMRRLWAAVQDAGVALGKNLLPVLTPVANMFGNLAQRVGKLSPTMSLVVVSVAAFVAAIGPLLLTLGLILGGLAPIVTAIAGAGGLSAAFGLAAGAVGSFLVAAAPFIAVAAAMAGAAILLYKNWNKVKSVFAPLAPMLRQVKGAIASVVPTIKNLGAVLKGLFTGNTGTEAFRKSFASLPGPVQDAVKRIIVAWYRLKNAFFQVRAAVIPVLKQIANGIRTGLVSAFKFLMRQGQQLATWFKSNWPQIRTAVMPVVQAIGRIIRTVLVGAFKFALQNAKILVNWFKQNWPLIQRTAETVMKIIASRVRTGFNLLKSIISTVVKAIVSLWKNNWTEIKSILQSVWKIIKSVVQTAIKNVLNILKLGMQVITGDWRGAWRTVKTILSDNWENIKTIVKNALRILGTVIKTAWNNLKSITLAAWNAIRNYIRDKLQDAKERAVEIVKALGQAVFERWESMKRSAKAAFEAIRDFIESRLETAKERATTILRNLGQAAFDRYEAMKRSAKAAFEAVRDFMVNPIESAYEGIKDWVDKILDVVNSVLKAVGLDEIKLGSSVESPGGNDSSGRGSRPARVARFAKGGMAREHRTNRFARGGLGTSGRQPKTHMWNEQMGNEAFIAEREPSRTQMPYLKAAAGWHGMDVVPRRSSVPSHRGGPDGTEEKRVHKHARGGISGLVRAFAYGGFGKEYYNSAASALDQAVMSRFPVDGSSYAGHPAGAVDFLVSSGQAQGQEKALGDSVAGWLDSNYGALNLRALIWYARARYEGGPWQPYVDNYGGGSGDVASQMHYNHPHAESLSSSFGKLNEDQTKGFTGGGGAGGGIGGAIQNAILDRFNKEWDRLVQPVADKFLKPLKSADYVMSNAVGAAGQKIPDGIKKWAADKLGLSGGSPGGSTQDPGQGGDNRAIGERMLKASGVPGSFSSLDSLWTKESNWDHKAQNPTSTAFGIPQFLDQTWQQYGGKSTEPTPQIDKGLQYIRDRYGGTDAAWQHSQANNWYSAGGMTNGPQRAVIGEAGRELVIPLENRTAIQASRNAMGTTEISERLESLERALVDKLDRVNLDTPSANHIVTGARNRAREVIRSTEGRGIIQTQNREIEKTQKLRRGR